MKKIALTNEIASSYLSDSVSESDYETLLNHPNNYLKSQFDADIDADINIVKNQPDLINIALPYYSGIENISSSAMVDEDLESVAGGELGFAVATIIAVIIGFTAGGIGLAAGVQAERGKNLDGSKK